MAKDLPLAVTIAVLIHNNRILLIKRKKGDYVGSWALPGGKVERYEHLSEAAVREIKEETGIRSNFDGHIGFVSEHLVENGRIQQHFLLHLCRLTPNSEETIESTEGQSEWFSMKDLDKYKEKIIPSDYMMIEKIVKKQSGNYFDCIIEKVGNMYILKKFESL